MGYNVEKFKQLARPLTPEERARRESRRENRHWLKYSAKIALTIRGVLRERGMKQIELAELMDVAPAQISKFLSGKTNFELQTISKLERVLGISILEITNPFNRPITVRERIIPVFLPPLATFTRPELLKTSYKASRFASTKNSSTPHLI